MQRSSRSGPPSSTRPSAEYERHHDVAAPRVDSTAFRQGWRVNSRLMQLHASGEITAGELQAAVDYQAAATRIVGLRGLALRERVDGGWRNGTDLSASKLDAAERLRWGQQDPALASIRDAAALKLLPTGEREACQKLWADVAAVLK